MRAFAALTILLTPPLLAQTPLCTQIKTLTQDSPAHWGISITTLDGTPLCQLDEAKLFRPASNAKLFTTAAALALLGPDKTFETKVTGNLDPKTGVVTGDLTLIGGGDANLDSGDLPYQPHPTQPAPPFAFIDLEDLATQLVAKGVKSVTGDIVGNDVLFPYVPYVPSWELEDIIGNDGAPVSALTIADNQLKLTVIPGQSNAPATVTLDQHGVSFYTVVPQVVTMPAKTVAGLQIERNPGSRSLRVYGSIAADASPDTEEISIDDPAAYAAIAFRQILTSHGIQVLGTTRAAHLPARNGWSFLTQLNAPANAEEAIIKQTPINIDCALDIPIPTLATHRSAPLAEDVTYTDKVSQNLHAELLQRTVGGIATCNEDSVGSGARMVRAFLVHAGIAPDDTLLYDGSGLSSHDLVTPRSLTQLLTYAAKQPWFSTYQSALPIGGVDGSLKSRFSGDNQPQLKGKVLAKTGTLGESRALSGYLTAASGQTIVFSILVDNHLPDTHNDRTLMDHIVELTAAAN